MRVKLVRHTGPRPPGMGIWWTVDDEGDIARAQKHFNELKAIPEEEVLSRKAEGRRGFDHAYDLLVRMPRDYGNRHEDWLNDSWGPVVPHAFNQNFIGIQLDPEPEVNEFGVVSP